MMRDDDRIPAYQLDDLVLAMIHAFSSPTVHLCRTHTKTFLVGDTSGGCLTARNPYMIERRPQNDLQTPAGP
jgi:hypothetical protein